MRKFLRTRATIGLAEWSAGIYYHAMVTAAWGPCLFDFMLWYGALCGAQAAAVVSRLGCCYVGLLRFYLITTVADGSNTQNNYQLLLPSVVCECLNSGNSLFPQPHDSWETMCPKKTSYPVFSHICQYIMTTSGLSSWSGACCIALTWLKTMPDAGGE